MRRFYSLPYLARAGDNHWTAFEGTYDVRLEPDPYHPRAPYRVTTSKFGAVSTYRCASVSDALDAAIAFENSGGVSWE